MYTTEVNPSKKSQLVTAMDTYVRDYKVKANILAHIAAGDGIPSVFELNAYTEAMERANGALVVLNALARTPDAISFDYLEQTIRREITGNVIRSSSYLRPIYEALTYAEGYFKD